jgi:hypothetical protein
MRDMESNRFEELGTRYGLVLEFGRKNTVHVRTFRVEILLEPFSVYKSRTQ